MHCGFPAFVDLLALFRGLCIAVLTLTLELATKGNVSR